MTPTTNNVGPTTSATERLRALLDERGVEWWQSANTLGCVFTRWYSPLFGDEVCAMENGEEGLVLFDHFVTPEQAIAATLGSCNCSNSERTSDSDATAERRGDAVEVVRCRDCKYVTDEGYGCKYFSHYEQGASYRWEDVPAEVEPDGFCAWGERRED